MKINYLIYDDMTLLDLVGPVQIWTNFPDVEANFVSKALTPVTTDSGLTVLPTHTFETAPKHPDIFFVPGGTSGTTVAASDQQTIDFVQANADSAGWVTSVCTGALVLGAAGLLTGYKAATHWAAKDILATLGATPVDDRYVIDRNRATGGGVTAGIDFGLVLMKEIAGEGLAKASQLALEYAPKPPFNSGTPTDAEAETIALVGEIFQESSAGMAGLKVLD